MRSAVPVRSTCPRPMAADMVSMRACELDVRVERELAQRLAERDDLRAPVGDVEVGEEGLGVAPVPAEVGLERAADARDVVVAHEGGERLEAEAPRVDLHRRVARRRLRRPRMTRASGSSRARTATPRCRARRLRAGRTWASRRAPSSVQARAQRVALALTGHEGRARVDLHRRRLARVVDAADARAQVAELRPRGHVLGAHVVGVELQLERPAHAAFARPGEALELHVLRVDFKAVDHDRARRAGDELRAVGAGAVGQRDEPRGPRRARWATARWRRRARPRPRRGGCRARRVATR